MNTDSNVFSVQHAAHDAPDLLRERFATVAARCEATLMRSAHRLTRGDDDRAQDLLQETLVRVYVACRAGKFDLDVSPAESCAYLRRALMNLFINQYRRHIKWDAGIDVNTLTAGGETGPAQTRARSADVPGETQLRETLDEELECALDALSDASRLAVILVDIEEHTYEEAARLLEVPIGTVRSRLARARQQLRELLYTYAQERRIVR